MDCKHLYHSMKPASRLHRLHCRECRKAYAADNRLASGIARLRAESVPADGLSQTLSALGLSPANRPIANPVRFKTLRRFSIPTGAVTAAVGVAAYGYLWYIDREPVVNVPPKVIPAKNAFDYFRDAGLQLPHSKPQSAYYYEAAISDYDEKALLTVLPEGGFTAWTYYVTPVKQDTSRNIVRNSNFSGSLSPGAISGAVAEPSNFDPDKDAYTDKSELPASTSISTVHPIRLYLYKAPGADHVDAYYQCIPGAEKEEAQSLSRRGGNFTPYYSLEDREQIIKKYAAALETMKQGFQYPYQDPAGRSPSALFPHYVTFRALARLNLVNEQIHIEREDWSGAMDIGLDTMQLGVMIPRGGPLIGELTGIDCEAIGRKRLWNIIDHLDADQARSAVARLESIVKLRVTLADTLQEEKWNEQMALKEMWHDRRWRSQLAAGMFGISNSNATPDERSLLNLLVYLKLLRYSKKEITANGTQYMDEAIKRAQSPYIPHQQEIADGPDPISQILFPTFSQAGFKERFTEAEDNLLLTALALRAYKCEHGTCPETLNALVPQYLTAVPHDPFGPIAQSHLRYYRNPVSDNRDYTLYSIGPDGMDNGGQVAEQERTRENSSLSRDRLRQVQINSSGDIVAGVNK